jgi:hypothetical protein
MNRNPDAVDVEELATWLSWELKQNVSRRRFLAWATRDDHRGMRDDRPTIHIPADDEGVTV